MPGISNSECKNHYGSSAQITNRMVCAGYVKGGGTDACSGDGGGNIDRSMLQTIPANFNII